MKEKVIRPPSMPYNKRIVCDELPIRPNNDYTGAREHYNPFQDTMFGEYDASVEFRSWGERQFKNADGNLNNFTISWNLIPNRPKPCFHVLTMLSPYLCICRLGSAVEAVLTRRWR